VEKLERQCQILPRRVGFDQSLNSFFRRIVTGPKDEYLYVLATHGLIFYGFTIWISFIAPSLDNTGFP